MPTNGIHEQPEAHFWRRYSPHHEFRLSSASSFALHALAAAGLVWAGFAIAGKSSSKPLALDVVEVEGEPAPLATGGTPMNGDGGLGTEEAASPTPPSRDPAPAIAPLPAPPAAQVPDLPDMSRSLPAIPADSNLDDLRKRVRIDIERRTAPNAARTGPATSGRPGAPGGTGDAPGGGANRLNVRQEREGRWTLIFNIRDGEEYLRQLIDLGAILAIPDPSGGYRVLRDFKRRPFLGKIEDIGKIDRIRWIDDNPQSVAQLSAALGIPPPPVIAAFFPPSLEEELARKEHAYAGRRESEIHETRFSIVRRAGRYDAVVISQR